MHTVGAVLKEIIPKDGLVKRYQADVFSVLLPFDDDQSLINCMTDLSAVLDAMKA